MPVATPNTYNPPQNTPNSRELARGLSEHVNAILPGMVAEAQDQGDLARVIGLEIKSRFTSAADYQWMFEDDEETTSISEDDARSYLESRIGDEHDEHLADVARELSGQAGALEPREGFSRAAIQIEEDDRGMHHTRVVGIAGDGDAQRITFFEPQAACTSVAVYDLGREWSGGEEFLHDGSVLTGYLTDDFLDDDGLHPRAATVKDAQGVHYQRNDPETYINFALHNGFRNEYPIEIPPRLIEPGAED